MQRFKRFYHRLPVIRELDHIVSFLSRISLTHVRQHRQALDAYERTLLGTPRYADPRHLARYGHQAYSQAGEDGMIAEIFRRIGTTTQTFLEIGVQDGSENNTSFLLLLGWSGSWIDADEKGLARARKQFRSHIDGRRLQLKQAYVSAENVAGLLAELQTPNEIDLFSLDIDQNTYWIWDALPSFRPRVVVVEYNAYLPAHIDWRVDYAPERVWTGNKDYGASLKAYENLGRKYGYSLVGCSLSGVNAFFVRDDLCKGKDGEDLFLPPFTAEHHYEPLRAFFAMRRN